MLKYAPSSTNNQIVVYQTADNQTQINVTLENETVWLTQAQIAELFQKDQSVIARHIANIFKEGELDKESNMQILHNTLSKYKPTAIYNLGNAHQRTIAKNAIVQGLERKIGNAILKGAKKLIK